MLLSSKEFLLAVVPGDQGESVLRYAKVDGQRILNTGEGVPGGLSGPMRASFFSPDSYFEQVDLAAASAKLLPLAARRHVDAELVFDEAYRLRVRSQAKRERTIAADIAAMPEIDLESATTMLPLDDRPCLQLVPVELTIAALVNKVSAEPAIVFWEKGGVLLSLLVAGGVVKTRTRERVNDENREVILARAESSLRASAKHLGENRDVFLVLFTGDLYGHVPEEREKASQVFEKKLLKLYRARRDTPNDAVMRDPELYGLPYVDKAWDFQGKEYRDQVQAWRYAKPAAALAALAGIGFAAVGATQHLYSMSLASDFDERSVKLQQTLSETQRILPSEQAMATARSGLQVQVESLSEVRLDRMLDWLTHLAPHGVTIRSLTVEPEPEPVAQNRRGARPVVHAPGKKPFLVNMEIMLADTSFDAAEASSAEVVRRLSQRLKIIDSRLDVPAPEPGVRRNIVLLVDAQAQAVNF